MDIQKRQPMKRIAVRLPPGIVDKAQKLAKKRGVRDSDVYRSIIVSFFKPSVNKLETDETTGRSKESA